MRHRLHVPVLAVATAALGLSAAAAPRVAAAAPPLVFAQASCYDAEGAMYVFGFSGAPGYAQQSAIAGLLRIGVCVPGTLEVRVTVER
ncbi:hypothetical protein [Roseisolibacter sp. H3M3-2]|uniref:hypothetical protein n=1 Tax=Roseisolibacter sp. H3M3-2 TaxID=3031323 RepID=UPI0023DBCD93|nr:hypothetical protein [Roseisolibacter sp. H3M3-2]MDF1503814.1 hypothetical protein [Roseisolibacter sp. H3M3-2]